MNMRKILAVLAAALMLCSVIPMGSLSVSAADGDVVIDYNFDDGVAHFERGYVENGYMVFDGTTASWQNCYLYANAMKANTDYVVTFKAKADKDASMSVKINNNWAGDTAEVPVSVTTEWQDFEVMINTGELTSTALVMFYSPYPAESAPIFCIDDLKIVEYVEPVEPGTVTNGDFETGDLSGWEKHQSTVISTDAHSGSYAANIKGDGGWGGMLNQDVPVEAGKTYKVSVWVKANANGANVQIKDGGTGGAVLASQWHTATEWTELVWEVIPTTDVICFNFCGGGNGVAEDVLVDDITVTELKQPSFDGFITNGDFEIGAGTPWTLYSGTAVDAVAAKDGAYGLYVKGPGDWGGTAYQDFTVEVGKTYVVTMDAKAITQGQNIQIKNGSAVVASKWFTTTEWTTLTFEFTATTTDARINISGGNTGSSEEIYVDNVFVFEKKDASNDGYIVNGDFETGVADPWAVYQSTSISSDAAHTGNFGMHIVGVGNWGGLLEQTVSGLTVGKNYAFSFWMKVNHKGVNVKIGDSYVGWYATECDWTLVEHEFTATATTAKILINGGGDGNANPDLAADLYVDDFSITELIDPSFDGYLYNGDFETGEVYPWDNLWGSCPTVEVVEDGMDSSYALNIVSGKWKHVRQTAIAVEANTWYKVTVWAKNTSDMILLVKDGGDSANLNQTGMTAGDEWTEFTGYFNSGDYTTVIVSLMGGENDEVAEKYGTFDNISMEVSEEPGCEQGYHKYFYACDTHCMECGEETNPDADHNVIHVEAKAAVSCIEYGNKEYWYCEHCGTAWLDANLIRQTNLMSVRVAGECVSDAEYACQDGVCVTCGLPYAADEAHTYDNDYDADCNVCGDVREVEAPEIIYGDANSDGIVDILDEVLLAQYNAGWDVTLDEAAADANGDGIVDILDEVLLAQYNAGWDVTLGSAG